VAEQGAPLLVPGAAFGPGPNRPRAVFKRSIYTVRQICSEFVPYGNWCHMEKIGPILFLCFMPYCSQLPTYLRAVF
jgi:hypothetical protein